MDALTSDSGAKDLRHKYPGWNIWASNTGDLYATRRTANGLEPRDATLCGPSLGELAERLRVEDASETRADGDTLAAFGE